MFSLKFWEVFPFTFWNISQVVDWQVKCWVIAFHILWTEIYLLRSQDPKLNITTNLPKFKENIQISTMFLSCNKLRNQTIFLENLLALQGALQRNPVDSQQPLFEIFAYPCHITTVLDSRHYYMINATQGSSSNKQTNKCKNQANNVVEVVERTFVHRMPSLDMDF